MEQEQLPYEQALEIKIKQFNAFGANKLTAAEIVDLLIDPTSNEDVEQLTEQVELHLTLPNSPLGRAYRKGKAERKLNLYQQLMTAVLNGSVTATNAAISLFCDNTKEEDKNGTTINNNVLVLPSDVLPQIDQEIIDVS